MNCHPFVRLRGDTVKGAAAGQPGQVVFVDFPEPEAQEQDVILSVSACGVCATDVKMVQKGAKDTRFALGHELAGKVIKTSSSQAWKIGQRVAVAPYLPCDQCYYCTHGQPALCRNLYAISIMPGGLAERVLVPAELARRGMFALPDDLSDEAAALAEPLGCVIKGLEDAHLQPGDSLVVIGDGPMGQLVAAAGKALGCSMVIMAGMTEHRLKFAQGLFADRTIDISRENLKEVVSECTEKRGADVVLVTVSSGETLTDGISLVRPGGWVNAFAGVPEGTHIELDVRKLHYQQYNLTGSSGLGPLDMKKALGLLQAGKVDFSRIITARFPFSQAAEAVAYMEKRVGLKAMVTFS
jgi:L-iditol 2-dehydrogenase